MLQPAIQWLNRDGRQLLIIESLGRNLGRLLLYFKTQTPSTSDEQKMSYQHSKKRSKTFVTYTDGGNFTRDIRKIILFSHRDDTVE